jgi:hypothetical protein
MLNIDGKRVMSLQKADVGGRAVGGRGIEVRGIEVRP